jgi:hypothetical protein
MKFGEFLAVSFNVGLLAIFYTVFGGLFSYGLYFFVDVHDCVWETQSLWYKLYDTGLELVIIGLFAFWPMYYINKAPPVIPVSREMDQLVDTYISGIFFVYAMFIFLDDLASKIKSLYKTILGNNTSRKTNENKNTLTCTP